MQQALVGESGERRGVERAGVERVGHEALVHRRRATHRVMPVHVPVHLILGEQQRLERRQPLLDHADGRLPGVGIADERQRVDQTVDVDLAVAHAAHERVAPQVVELVEVDRAGNQSLQRALARRRE